MRVLDPGRTVTSLAFHPAGHTLAGGYFEAVGLWDVAAGTERLLPLAPSQYALGACFSPAGNRLAFLANTTHRVARLDIDRVFQRSVRGRATGFGRPADHGFLPAGRLLVLRADRLVAFDPATGAEQPCGPDPGGTRLRVCPAGEWVAVAGDELRLWRVDAAGGRWEAAPRPGVKQPDRLQFCGPGLLWLTAGDRTGVWDCAAGDWRAGPVKLPSAPLAVGPDGRQAVVRLADYEIGVVDLAGGGVVRAFDWGVGLVEAAAVAPDGLTAAVAGPGGLIALFDLD